MITESHTKTFKIATNALGYESSPFVTIKVEYTFTKNHFPDGTPADDGLAYDNHFEIISLNIMSPAKNRLAKEVLGSCPSWGIAKCKSFVMSHLKTLVTQHLNGHLPAYIRVQEVR